MVVLADAWTSEAPFINSSPASAAYMCRCSGSALVQVMAWCRTGNMPLPESGLAYCQLDSWKQI